VPKTALADDAVRWVVAAGDPDDEDIAVRPDRNRVEGDVRRGAPTDLPDTEHPEAERLRGYDCYTPKKRSTHETSGPTRLCRCTFFAGGLRMKLSRRPFLHQTAGAVTISTIPEQAGLSFEAHSSDRDGKRGQLGRCPAACG
jgi:hypothetical protein